MVEQKKTKRERDIKSKLMAAIAMLLVSSIMMVSTTYAWFTLSTAPEVTGITTSIASNGNLEIALSPESGMGTDVGDATTQTEGWLAKNLTWGNLVDMKDVSYGLSSLTLAPAELAAAGDATAGYTLVSTGILATPKYGSDGRISDLMADALIGSKGASGSFSKPGTGESFKYGVRAVGTASGQSLQQKNFSTNVNNIVNYANAAIANASNSLSSNGNALASMLVQHAEAGSDDDNNYAIYVPALVALTNDLDAAADNVENALKAAILASVSSIADETAYTTAYNNLKAATTLDAMKAILTTNQITLPAQFTTIEGKLTALRDTISQAQEGAADLMEIVDTNGDDLVDTTVIGTDDDGNDITKPTATVLWTDAGDVLTALMNTNGTITVSGYTIAEIKSHMSDTTFLLNLAKNCQIELGAGSGVYYDLAELTGNISAKTSATITARGMTVTLDNVIIKTVVPANTSLLPLLKTAVSTAVTPSGGSNAVLDAYYGYIIDLMVRTNAADSYLKLQTEGAQRVYSDSSSEATMGGGTTIIFTTTDADDVASINDLCKSIRLVFFDPTDDANEVFGMAKVTTVLMTEAETGNYIKDAEGNDTTEKEILYTITGKLELCNMVADTYNTGMYLAGDVLTGETAAKLCDLTQNVPQAVSVLVYLDGNNVTSADVLADKNVTGALNLQFASSATLKPMENSDLRNMTVEG